MRMDSLLKSWNSAVLVMIMEMMKLVTNVMIILFILGMMFLVANIRKVFTLILIFMWAYIMKYDFLFLRF